MVRYKLIEHERVEDAPFIGALVSAISCQLGCEGCFNQPLKSLPTQISSAEAIVDTILSNPFNEGIVLGGLEWSEQPKELVRLVEAALQKHLKVMIYTGYSLKMFFNRVPELLDIEGALYIKYGKYDASKSDPNYYRYGVQLASKNQGILNKTFKKEIYLGA